MTDKDILLCWNQIMRNISKVSYKLGQADIARYQGLVLFRLSGLGANNKRDNAAAVAAITTHLTSDKQGRYQLYATRSHSAGDGQGARNAAPSRRPRPRVSRPIRALQFSQSEERAPGVFGTF